MILKKGLFFSERLRDTQTLFNLLSKAKSISDLPLIIVQIEFIHELHKQTIVENGKLIYERDWSFSCPTG